MLMQGILRQLTQLLKRIDLRKFPYFHQDMFEPLPIQSMEL